MNELDEIMNLLAEWKDFKEQNGKNLADFGKWLSERHPKNDLDTGKVPINYPVEGIEMDAYAQIGRLWGRLGRFTHILTKKALYDLPLKSFDDFGILMYVRIQKNPTKSEIIKHSLLESTTCFEIIKRLVRLELLNEYQDQEDRRVIRVILTEKGLDILKIAIQRVYLTSRVLAADLNQEKRQELVKILGQLECFHSFIHESYPNAGLEDILKHVKN